VEEWLKSELKLRRLFAVAGLKFLGTPGAETLLRSLADDQTDFSDYMDQGTTMSTLAANALKGIELSADFERLKQDAIRDKIMAPEEVERVRLRMLQDMSLSAAALEKEYRAELKKRRDRYAEQKRKLSKILKKYQKAIRWICFKQIKEYPAVDKRKKLEQYIDNTAIACRVEAEKQLTKKKLDFFGFTPEIYRSAVILGIMKKEITRKYYVKAKARVYLRTAVEASMAERGVQKRLKKVKKWALDDAKLRSVVDKFVGIALGMAKEDNENTKGQRGISEADIKEYREYIELPEKYVLGSILMLMHRLEWVDTDESTGQFVAHSLLEDAARAAFNSKAYFEEQVIISDFLMENYDDLWYVFQDIATFDDETTKKRWGISDEAWANYAALSKKVRSVVDATLAKAVKDELISEDKVAIIKDAVPTFEIVADIMINEFDVVRKKRIEEEKKAAEAAKKAAAKKGEEKDD